MVTASRRHALAALLLIAGACSDPQTVAQGRAFEADGGLARSGDLITAPQRRGDVPEWFNGIWITNTSTGRVLLKSAMIIRLDAGIHLERILFALGNETEPGRRGAFTAECGREPPPGFRWHSAKGLEVMPGERVLPLVGLTDPLKSAGGIHGLRIAYVVAGKKEVFTQDFYYEVKFREDVLPCRPPADE